ncbi:MAG: MBOAT family protein [Candidatus Tumulicola sp.]
MAAFALADAVAFYGALYRPLLDPDSTTGAFEGAVARIRAAPLDARHDVLVLGDSRIYSGLDPAVASGAASGRFRFVNGSVPGTTPRCWYFFARAIDPAANRFRAIVIPFDSYGDDRSAIGSLDGDMRQTDLRYIVFQVYPRDLPKLTASFGDWRRRLSVGADMLLRGPILRDDVQSLVSDPLARVRAIRAADGADGQGVFDAHPRSESLAGLKADFRHTRMVYPAGVRESERNAIATHVFADFGASPSYALYRRRWIGPLVRRYLAAGVPVIFVRLPTRPANSGVAQVVGSALREFRSDGARLLPQTRYLALERPELFADADHLNAGGGKLFSAFLGRDVARAIGVNAASIVLGPGAGEPAIPPAAPCSWKLLGCLRTFVGIGSPLPLQSYEFWIFVAVVAALFYALRAHRRARLSVLLIASYYFYARWNGWYVLFLWILTLSDFAIAIVVEAAPATSRRVLLTLGVALNLAFLATFKYLNFASGTVAALLGMHENPWLVNLIVPIGISFHTFQSISYLVDVERGKMRATKSLLDYAVYLSFFPQLLAGPIVRAGLFLGELLRWRKPSADDMTYGLARIAFGLVKKICIADQFAQVSDKYFGSMGSYHGSVPAICAVFAFTMQIYFDFSGYSDIAIGTARLFGFVFPENFVQPYLANSIADFWHRWHITLSTWLRDYVYIPLGGNRHGRLATVKNLMLTMLLGGLWHGAQWTFVAWGAYHGILLSLERMFGVTAGASAGARYYVRVAFTFVLVSLGWVLFRAPGFAAAGETYIALFTGGWGPWLLSRWQTDVAVCIVAFGILWMAVSRLMPKLSWSALSAGVQAAFLVVALFAVELFSWPGTTATFIYFKF